jgi:8-oxo-dGTP diphosphatase
MNNDSALIIKAAGGVIFRRNEIGERVFAIIHKREYGEWCLPKGKVQVNEDWRDAATREVNEETGSSVRVLEPVAVSGYIVKGVPKIVVFFAMEASGSAIFTPSREVDRVEWLNEAEIRGQLSHVGERRAFDEIIQALDVREDRKS